MQFVFSIFFFPKIVPFMRYCKKIWWIQRDHKWRLNMEHTRCILYKQSYTHARAYIHRQLCHTYRFSTAKMIRARASLLRYAYIACLVYYYLNMAECTQHSLWILYYWPEHGGLNVKHFAEIRNIIYSSFDGDSFSKPKNKKALGVFKAQLLKLGRRKLIQLLHKSLDLIWKEEKIRNECKMV